MAVQRRTRHGRSRGVAAARGGDTRVPVWPGMIAPAPPRPPARKHGRRGVLVGSAATVGTVLVIGGLVLSRVDARAPTPPGPVVGTAALGLGGGAECEPVRTADLVRGNGVGSTESGPDAILAFQHAYYVTRSGTAARAVTAPGAWVSPATVIDVGIATVPVGTRHCVEIVPQPSGAFFVTVTETRLDRSTRIYRQFVTVGGPAGTILITRIDPVRAPR